jgi:hypothetical protein
MGVKTWQIGVQSACFAPEPGAYFGSARRLGESAMLFMTCGGQPALRCAICDHPIVVATTAVVVYPRGIGPGEMHRTCLSHDGECLALALASLENDSGPACWMGLAEYGDRLLKPVRSDSDMATPVPIASRARRSPQALGGERRKHH